MFLQPCCMKTSLTVNLNYMKRRSLTPAYHTHRFKKGPSKVSDTGLGGKRLASRDGVEEFHHLRNLILWSAVILHVATIWSFSRVISGTSLQLQCFSIWSTTHKPPSYYISLLPKDMSGFRISWYPRKYLI